MGFFRVTVKISYKFSHHIQNVFMLVNSFVKLVKRCCSFFSINQQKSTKFLSFIFKIGCKNE